MSRYARHLALTQIGDEGQARIGRSTALIIGLGGIGCATASYLTCAGVGQLLLCDFDTVDETNLGRQTLYGPSDIGQLKAVRAASRLAAMNPDVRLTEIPDRLSDDALAEAASMADVVLDGCDNFPTRFQVNDAAVRSSTVLSQQHGANFGRSNPPGGPTGRVRARLRQNALLPLPLPGGR
jgi:adenylyltransferase/sulfurtransferase